MRNTLAKILYMEERRFAVHLKQIWLQPDRKSAYQAAGQLIQLAGRLGRHGRSLILRLAASWEKYSLLIQLGRRVLAFC